MPCPICGEETRRYWRPFCSRRCADRDLGRWLNGTYAIHSRASEDVEKAAEEADRAADRNH